MKRSKVRKLVAETLRVVALELDGNRPSTWPDTPDDERAATRAANDALDVVQRALNRVADTMTSKAR